MTEAPRPVRLRLSRAKGFDLQALSRATNGLPCVNVARPSRWGNPYRVTPEIPPALAVQLYREHLATAGAHSLGKLALRTALATELRGHNLACWCAPGAPCHADVLLERANPPIVCEPA